jgi:hypothetical protein
MQADIVHDVSANKIKQAISKSIVLYKHTHVTQLRYEFQLSSCGFRGLEVCNKFARSGSAANKLFD